MSNIPVNISRTTVLRVGASPSVSQPDIEDNPPINPNGSGGLSHKALTLGTDENGLILDVANQVLEMRLASGSQTGALSSTDWNTFNSKVGGSGSAGQVAFWTGANTQGGDSGFTWDNVNKILSLSGNTNTGYLEINNRKIDFITGLATAGIYQTGQGGSGIFATIGALVLQSRSNANLPVYIVTGSTPDWRWAVLGNGIFQSNGAQTIQASGTQALTLQGNGGNVGIGTTAPTNTLDVDGTARIRTVNNLATAPASVLVPSATGVVSSRTLSEFRGDIGAEASFTKGNLVEGSGTALTGTLTSRLVGTGNVTIAVDSTVVRTSGNQTIGGNKTFTDPLTFNFGLNVINFDRTGASNWWAFGHSNNGDLSLIRRNTSGEEIDRPVIVKGGTGNVGIGTTSPSDTLDVNGTARIRTIDNLGTSPSSVLVPSATGVVSERTLSEFAGDLGVVPSSRTLTINGETFDLSANRSWSIPTHDPLTLGTPNGLSLSGQELSLGLASGNTNGALSSTDWNTFNSKVGGSGSSGQVSFWTGAGVQSGDSGFTFVSNRLNAPEIRSKYIVSRDATSYESSSPDPFIYASASVIGLGQGSGDLILSSRTNLGRSIHFVTNNGTSIDSRWLINSNGIFQSNGAQTIQASGTQALTLQGNGGNVGIGTTSPTNTLDVDGTARIRTVNNLGTAPASVLVPSATGVVSERTLSEFAGDLGALPTSAINIASGQVAFGTGSNQIGGDSGLLFNATTKVLTTTADAVVNGVDVGRGGGGSSTNTRVGVDALQNNTNGSNNTAIGRGALEFNTTGSSNTAIGTQASRSNTTGFNNIANGLGALIHNTTGGNNTAIGTSAGRRIANAQDLTISNNSIFIGFDTRALGDNQTNQIVIGHTAIGAGSNTVTLGNASIVKTVLRGTLNAADLPTSAAGLQTGDIYNDGGTLKIV